MAPSRTTGLGYIRKSKVKRDGPAPASPEVQENACRAAAAQLGLQLEIYADAEGHRTGKNEDRPAWRRLKKRLTDPDVGALIVHSWDRPVRNTKLLLQLVDELDALGVRFIATTDNIDTRTASGRFQLTIIAAVGEYESSADSERRISSIEHLRRVKGRHYGLAPFGSERAPQDNELVLVASRKNQPNGTDFDALRRAYELYSEGHEGYRPIARRLNREGWQYRDRHGRLRSWTPDDVRRVLCSHWIYSGYVTVGRAYRDQIEVLKGSHNEILPESLTAPVAARFSSHRRGMKRQRLNLEYPLTGVLHCRCGQRLRGNVYKRGRKYRHIYGCECGHKYEYNADELELAVRVHVAGLTIPDDLISRSTSDLTRLLSVEQSGRSVGAEQERVRMSLNRLNELYVDGLMDRAALDKKRAELLAELPVVQAGTPSTAGDLLALDSVTGALEHAPAAMLRSILQALYDKITIADRGGDLKYEAHEWCRAWAS